MNLVFTDQDRTFPPTLRRGITELLALASSRILPNRVPHDAEYSSVALKRLAMSWMGQSNTERGSKTYESENRLNVGNSENVGLANVNDNWHDNIGFRVLAVLS